MAKGISYLAMGEWFYNDKPTLTEYQFFSDSRARFESPKTQAKADKWLSAKLREHGTHNCRVSISKVLWSITG